MSPGWQLSVLQIASRVEKRIAFALPVLSMQRFAGVMPIFSASSSEVILRIANKTSKSISIIFGTPLYIVSSFSALISTAFCITFLMTRSISPTKAAAIAINKKGM